MGTTLAFLEELCRETRFNDPGTLSYTFNYPSNGMTAMATIIHYPSCRRMQAAYSVTEFCGMVEVRLLLIGLDYRLNEFYSGFLNGDILVLPADRFLEFLQQAELK